MSDMNERDSNQEAVPFFARFLEGQLDYMEDMSEEEIQAMAGGSKAVTRKFPSDQEDHSGGKPVIPKKCPSDPKDHSGGILEYPSDADEAIS